MRTTEPYSEVISGPMFSGKTTELLKQYREFKSYGFNVQIFRWFKDERSGIGLSSHSGIRADINDVRWAKDARDIENSLSRDTDVVMIDEAQFFGGDLPNLIEDLIKNGKIVVASLLPLDYSNQIFGTSPELLARADYITQLTAHCTFKTEKLCLKPATKSFRTINTKEQVLIGGAKSYQPRCRKHFTKGL